LCFDNARLRVPDIHVFFIKRRWVIGLLVAALFTLAIWRLGRPHVEVHGKLSAQDVAEIRAEIQRMNGPAFFRKPSLANAAKLPRDLRDSMGTRFIAIYAISENNVTVVTSTRRDEMSLSLHKNSSGWDVSPVDGIPHD
jgi:hypothetical protein